MKRAYVKPVMESEAFVANEYVAACWTVSCSGCGAVETGYETLKGELKEAGYDGILGNYSTYVHIGSLGNAGNEKLPCTEYKKNTYPAWCDKLWEKWIWDNILSYWFTSQEVTKYHPVEIQSGHPNHPYASV